VSVCDCEASITRRHWPTGGSRAMGGGGGNKTVALHYHAWPSNAGGSVCQFSRTLEKLDFLATGWVVVDVKGGNSKFRRGVRRPTA
jgi:hypothetical protein